MNEYLKAIGSMRKSSEDASPKENLLRWEDKSKKLQCFYAPFEHINPDAELILVGITPGKTQMNIALNSAIDSISAGKSVDSILYKAKRDASFSGTMRNNLIKILNCTGYQKKLGISCASELWKPSHNHLVQFTSLLKYPVFKDGKNYNDAPNLNVIKLSEMIDEFVRDLELINPDAILIPLGDKVSKVINILNKRGSIKQKIFTVDENIVAPPILVEPIMNL